MIEFELRSDCDLKNSVKIALCGVIAALSAVIMFLTGVIPIATVALPALAGLLLVPVVAELGLSWGFGVFAVCAVISFLIAPDREAALIYTLFFGYYPVLFGALGKIKSRAVRVAIKLLLFNAAAVAEAALTVYVLGIPWENVGILGDFTAVVLLALANVVFVLYERALRGVIALYFAKYHARVRRLTGLK